MKGNAFVHKNYNKLSLKLKLNKEQKFSKKTNMKTK